MSIIKRCTISITSYLDRVICQVENHGALVEAAIQDMQYSKAKLRAELARIRREMEEMQKGFKKAESLESVWAERALRVQSEDRNKALQCLSRRRQCREERARLAEQIAAYQQLEERIISDSKVVEERILELKRKRSSFNAREFRVEADCIARQFDNRAGFEVTDLFERWETKLSRCEVAEPYNSDLETQFVREEEQSELEAELSALMNERANEGDH